MASEEGEFTYKSDGSPKVCGLYFIAPTEKLVAIEFTAFNIDCKTGLAVVSNISFYIVIINFNLFN